MFRLPEPKVPSRVRMDALGLHAGLLLGGFLGSLVFIACQPGPPQSWWALASPIIAGTLTANYLPWIAINYFFGQAAAVGTGSFAASFTIGVSGPWVGRSIIRKAQNWSPNGGKHD